MHRNQFGLTEIPASDSTRPSHVADRRKSLGFSQTFLRSFSPVKAKISIVTRRGCWAEKIFVGMMLLCPQEEEKTKKKSAWLDAADYAAWRSCPAGPRGRGILKVAAILWTAPICETSQLLRYNLALQIEVDVAWDHTIARGVPRISMRRGCGCGRRPHSSPKGEPSRGSGGMLFRKILNLPMPEIGNLTLLAIETTGNKNSVGPCSLIFFFGAIKCQCRKLCAERRHRMKSCSPDDCVCMKL